MTANCIGVYALLTSALLHNIVVPIHERIPLGNTSAAGAVVISDLRCPALAAGGASVRFDAGRGLQVDVLEGLVLNCTLDFSMPGSAATGLALVLGAPNNQQNQSLRIAAAPALDGSCYASSANVTANTLGLAVSELALLPLTTPGNDLANFVLASLVKPTINKMISTEIGRLVSGVAADYTNRTLDPLVPAPPFQAGARSVANFPLAKAIRTIFTNLPVVLGFRLAADFPTPTSMQLNVTTVENMTIGAALPPMDPSAVEEDESSGSLLGAIAKRVLPSSAVALRAAVTAAGRMLSSLVSVRVLPARVDAGVPGSTVVVPPTERPNKTAPALPADALGLHVPAGVTLSIDVGFGLLICSDDGLSCVASDGISVDNLRVIGAGTVSKLVDATLRPLLRALIADLLPPGQPVAIALTPKVPSNNPPQWVLVLMGPLMGVLFVGVIAFSAMRHIRRPVLDYEGRPIPLRRVMLEDAAVTSLCFAAMFMFTWSNTTSFASAVVGGELSVYVFSLPNTVHDMWAAGMYPLSILVCLFTGTYPYVKLIAIVVLSVILQRPQSRLLHVIDTMGRFSLLDTFIMTIIKTGIQIQGIAEVHIDSSYYTFVIATVVSIVVGNYATFGWRRETSIRQRKAMNLQQCGLASLAALEAVDPAAKVRQSLQPAQTITTGADGTLAEPLIAAEESVDDDDNGSDRTVTVRVKQHMQLQECGDEVNAEATAAVRRPSTPTTPIASASTTSTHSSKSPHPLSPTVPSVTDVATTVAANVRNTAHTESAQQPYLLRTQQQQQPTNTGTHKHYPIGSEGDICRLLEDGSGHPTAATSTAHVTAATSVATASKADLFGELVFDIPPWYVVWEWRLAVPCAVVVVALSVVATAVPNITYHISGLASLVTGTRRALSLYDLFVACDPLLIVVGFVTILVAPCIYVLTFPHGHVLGSWCATDAFLLACISGLLQLEQFIVFVFGEAFRPIFSVYCVLQWPLLLWTASVLVQWMFLLKQTLGIAGLPTFTKIRQSFR